MILDVKEAITTRRAYRALAPFKIDDALIWDLAESIQLTPSCFNNQPWRFIFIRSPSLLKKLHTTLSPNNRWVHASSLIAVVYSKKDLDCLIKEREYFLFDTGMATAFLILRATELGFVAHPIAGYDEEKVKNILNLPEEVIVITLVIIGKHADTISELLTEKQAETEYKRPNRKPVDEFILVR
ncbi:MAG: nitroreductase family protein [Candidatus Hodarchaeota archaeon]